MTPAVGPARGRRPERLRRGGDDAPVEQVAALAAGLPAEAWQTVRWREGVAEVLAARFAAVRVRPAQGDHRRSTPRPEHWLVAEWPIDDAAPTKFWLSNLPADTSIDRLVGLAKLRWLIERDYLELKQELGLYQRTLSMTHGPLASAPGCSWAPELMRGASWAPVGRLNANRSLSMTDGIRPLRGPWMARLPPSWRHMYRGLRILGRRESGDSPRSQRNRQVGPSASASHRSKTSRRPPFEPSDMCRTRSLHSDDGWHTPRHKIYPDAHAAPRSSDLDPTRQKFCDTVGLVVRI